MIIVPERFITHTDNIPVLGYNYDIYSIKDGLWHEDVWDNSHPALSKDVLIQENTKVTVVSAECHELVVMGHLVIDGTLNVRTITVLPTGHLEVLNNSQVTFQDSDFELNDPFQFGVGIVTIDGKLTVKGNPKQTWAKVKKDIFANDTSIQLESAPNNWEVGDVLVLPDTRQPTNLDEVSSHVEEVTIVSINGNIVHTTPIIYDHIGWKNQKGKTEELFSVGNLNQSVVFKSESPSGIKAHMLFAQHSDVEMSNFVVVDMGRTTTEPIHNSDGVTFGNNQIARYPIHMHHLLGRMNNGKDYQYSIKDFVIHGSPKFGVATHGSHFGLVQGGFVYNCAGAGIVTELPTEYENEIDSNLIIGKQDGSNAYINPQGGTMSSITARAHRNQFAGDHWHNKVGFGLASAANKITNNEVYSCFDAIGMAGFGTTQMRFPLVRGKHFSNYNNVDLNKTWFHYKDSNGDYSGTFTSYPWKDTSNNKIMGCFRGIETWTANSFVGYKEKMFPNLQMFNIAQPTDFEDQRETTTYNWKICGDFNKAQNNYGLTFKGGYEFGHTHFNMTIKGYHRAYRSIFPSEYVKFINCQFECPIVLYQPFGHYAFVEEGDVYVLFKDCVFNKVNDNIVFADGNYPHYGPELWAAWGYARPDRKYLKRYKMRVSPWFNGKHLDIYHYCQDINWQLPEKRQVATSEEVGYVDFPPGVITNRELTQLGTPIYGEVIPEGAKQFGQWFYYSEIPQSLIELEDKIENL